MTDGRRVGLRPIPEDVDIAEFLYATMQEYRNKAKEKVKELDDTIEETIRSDQPPIFAFGKMLNYLATLEKPELIELLAGSLWSRCW